MINSFWNICSTCPMPREEKLNSEYKRNYVWHPNYKPVPQDVVTLPPQTLAKELGIQRKKQYPSLAYRTSEVIGASSAVTSQDAVDLRTRSEERNGAISSKSGPGSRSAEPGVGRLHQKKIMVQSYPPLTSRCGALVPKIEEFPNIIEKAHKNTEYRSQFAWPSNTRGEVCTARKSVSMGLIKAPDQPDSSAAPKDKTDHSGPMHRSVLKEMEMPSIAEKPTHKEKPPQDVKKKQSKTEYNAKYKPFTSYVYVEGQWKKTSRLIKICEREGMKMDSQSWYSEVMERLQKANAYKCRGHGHPVYGEQLPNIYMQQTETTPLVRPKKDLPEIHIPSFSADGKKIEGRKKERYERKIDKKPEDSPEKKPEREKKKSSRPKSAEPSKGRTPRSQQPRPQTAPPPIREKSAPAPAHYAYAKKTATKSRSPETKQSTRPYSARSSSRKPKEGSSRSMLPPDGRASRTSHHPPPQSGSGKVWLQAGAAPEHHSPERENFKGKHSDAVRPSTLLPPPPKSPAKEEEEDLKESLPTELLKEKEAAIGRKTSSPTPVPLTHVQTPEEVTGVKSPEPENWTVPLDKGQKLQWTESSSTEPLSQPGKISSPKIENVEKETDDSASKLPPVSEKESSPVAPQEPYSAAATSSSRMTTADVLDRARSRLDQFWGKNK